MINMRVHNEQNCMLHAHAKYIIHTIQHKITFTGNTAGTNDFDMIFTMTDNAGNITNIYFNYKMYLVREIHFNVFSILFQILLVVSVFLVFSANHISQNTTACFNIVIYNEDVQQ